MGERQWRKRYGPRWGKCGSRARSARADQFRERGVKLNSTGGEPFNLAWADETATGLICWRCGYVHLFVNREIQLHRVKK